MSDILCNKGKPKAEPFLASVKTSDYAPKGLSGFLAYFG
jgi:hypothetical protein